MNAPSGYAAEKVDHRVFNEAAPRVDKSGPMFDKAGGVLFHVAMIVFPPGELLGIGAEAAEGGEAAAAVARALPAASRTARLTQEGVEHIALRHFPTSGATGAGKFATTSLRELRSLINEAVAQGTIRPNTLGRAGSIFELNVGRQIGTNVAGNAATSLRVVVTPEGVVKTAFPF